MRGCSRFAASSATAAQKTGCCMLMWRSTTPQERRRRCLAARRRRSWVAASTAAALARPDAHPAAAACRASCRCWSVAAPCCGQPVGQQSNRWLGAGLPLACCRCTPGECGRLVVGWRQVPVAWVHKGAVRNSKQAHRSPPAVVQVQTNRYEVCRNTEVIISL